MGRRNLQTLAGHGRGQIVQQSRPIPAIDFDHRMSARRQFVADHPGRHLENGGAIGQARAFSGQLLIQPHLTGQDFFHILGDIGQPMGFGHRAAVGGLHPKGIQRHAVGQSGDAGIDDIDAAQGHGSGDFREQTGMVAHIDGDFRRPARQILAIGDGQWDAGLQRLRDQFGMIDMTARIVGDPIAGIAQGHMGVDGLVAPSPGLQFTAQGFDGGTAAGLGFRRQIAGHGFFRPQIQFPQQARLPGVPHRRTYRPDIGHGQQHQKAQPFGALDLADEIADGLGIVDIPFECCIAHQQMIAHQPGHGFGLGRVQTQQRPPFIGHFGPQYRMVAVAAFGHIMEKHRQIQNVSAVNLVDDRGGQRQGLGQGAIFDGMQHPHRLDGVLVHRIDVIHVVLHLGHHPAEFRNQPSQNPGFVHMAQRHFRVFGTGQHLHEQFHGFRLPPHLGIDQPQMTMHQIQGVGMNIQPIFQRRMEQTDHRQGIGLELAVIDHI